MTFRRRALRACARAIREFRRRAHIHLRENWYRDLWLIALSVVLGILAVKALQISADSNRAADLAIRAATAIQQQRIDTIRTSCESQNAEHDRGIKTLNEHIPHGTRGWHITKLLIEQLAPPQDCERVIRQATRTPSALPALDEKFPPFLPRR